MKSSCLTALVVAVSLTLAPAGAARRASVGATPLRVLTEPGAGFGAVYSFILSARRSLDMTMYELEDPEAEHDLAMDAERGVDVRVLLDRAYSGKWANRQAAAELAGAGVHVEWAPPSVIVHQKTVVVDNAAALVMTANLTSRYYAGTADLLVEDRRAADVTAIVRAFDGDWAGDLAGSPYRVPVRGQVGDLIFSPGSEQGLLGLIASARSSLETSSEEMASAAVVSALEADARRGVDVEVLMTQDPSWTGALRRLVSAGAHVRLYPYSEKALYIHAKLILVDGRRAYVGSINYSTSSMVYNRELGVVTADPAVVGPVTHAFAQWWTAAPLTL